MRGVTKLMELHGMAETCDRGHAALLFVTIRGRRMCAACWHDAGEPAPPYAPPKFEVEQAIREGMKKRGGEDLHRVVAGKS